MVRLKGKSIGFPRIVFSLMYEVARLVPSAPISVVEEALCFLRVPYKTENGIVLIFARSGLLERVFVNKNVYIYT